VPANFTAKALATINEERVCVVKATEGDTGSNHEQGQLSDPAAPRREKIPDFGNWGCSEAGYAKPSDGDANRSWRPAE
jgi:hypothetical protein